MRIDEIITDNTITLWHGGRGLEHSFRDVTPSSRGRWEYGPGLYLTNRYERAAQYARGNRRIYKVTFERGNDIRGVSISISDVAHFAKKNISASKRGSFLQDISANAKRTGNDTVSAIVFLNLMINGEYMPSSKTGIIAQFLVDHGVDYYIDSYGGFSGEKVVVIFNRSKITKVVPYQTPKKMDSAEFEPIDVPN